MSNNSLFVVIKRTYNNEFPCGKDAIDKFFDCDPTDYVNYMNCNDMCHRKTNVVNIYRIFGCGHTAQYIDTTKCATH